MNSTRWFAGVIALMAFVMAFPGGRSYSPGGQSGANQIIGGPNSGQPPYPGENESPAWGPGAWKDLLSTPWVMVSPTGASTTGVPNNGADYGPDTSGTQTNGIQEAWNSGRLVVLLGTKYVTNTDLIFPTQFVGMIGVGASFQTTYGKGETIIQASATGLFTHGIMTLTNAGANNPSAYLRGFTLDGNQACVNPFYVSITTATAQEWLIEQVQSTNGTGHSWYLSGTSDWTLRKCYDNEYQWSSPSGKSAYLNFPSEDCSFYNCHFSGSIGGPGAGISAGLVQQVEFIDCILSPIVIAGDCNIYGGQIYDATPSGSSPPVEHNGMVFTATGTRFIMNTQLIGVVHNGGTTPAAGGFQKTLIGCKWAIQTSSANAAYAFKASGGSDNGVIRSIGPTYELGTAYTGLFREFNQNGSGVQFVSSGVYAVLDAGSTATFARTYINPPLQSSPVSGTVYQNTTGIDAEMMVQITLTPTAGATATCVINCDATTTPRTPV